ncbi:MAG: mltG [Alphaproteobacteria bacterium]|nr:mltG [Alphaproteobacteria bacterium]
MRRKLVVLGLLVAAALGFYFVQGWNGSGPARESTSVVIPRGASLVSAAATLKRAGVISSTSRFLFQAKLFGGKRAIFAGEYEFPAHASYKKILTMLQSGKTLQRFVVIPEGLPSVLVQDRLVQAPALTGEAALPEEGSVLPDSYSYQRGEKRTAVLGRMQAAMRKTLDRLWPERSPDSVVRTKAEALTLASIVEKETAKPSERPMIAGVYGNRLKAGMPLQADPTIIYPITRGRPLGRQILKSEVEAHNGYNTYTMRGLPAGPIANPGRASIEAVLKPARTDALYFVADGTGGHVFANTLAEHNANVVKWRALRRERGI